MKAEPIETIQKAVTGPGRMLTQAELAEAAGVAESTVSAIVRGTIRNPGITTVYRLLNAIEDARIRARPAVVDRERGRGRSAR